MIVKRRMVRGHGTSSHAHPLARLADFDVKTGRGRTPLQLAVAASRRPRIVNVGAERSGETAADVLRELGAKESSR